jgi:putative FmdB family regulatory protein
MPTYDYRCNQCQHSLEIQQKITEDPIKLCPQCGHETLRRGPGGGIGLLFKGNGFYKTEYASSRPVETDPTKAPCCPCGKAQASCHD